MTFAGLKKLRQIGQVQWCFKYIIQAVSSLRDLLCIVLSTVLCHNSLQEIPRTTILFTISQFQV